MKRLMGWLARLWRGVPEHVTKHDPTKPWSNPEHDVKGDMRAYIEADRARNRVMGPPPGLTNIDVAYKELRKPLTDRDLLSDEEKALWADIEGNGPKPETIAYPPPAEQSTQDWVTERLMELTGGLTRHPADRTEYPTPPTEADLAAREQFPAHTFAMNFSHGMSMQYLGQLKRRAEQHDYTLTAEELMGLRARGLA